MPAVLTAVLLLTNLQDGGGQGWQKKLTKNEEYELQRRHFKVKVLWTYHLQYVKLAAPVLFFPAVLAGCACHVLAGCACAVLNEDMSVPFFRTSCAKKTKVWRCLLKCHLRWVGAPPGNMHVPFGV
jgi:hypothetical protein